MVGCMYMVGGVYGVGCAWQRGMHGRGCAWQEGHAWRGGMSGGGGGGMRGRYYEICSMSGRYASYWNAFLLAIFAADLTRWSREAVNTIL